MEINFKIKELCEVVNGEYYGGTLIDYPITDFEFAPNEMTKKESSQGLCFIAISNERWNKEHGRETNWRDGHEAVQTFSSKCQLIITEDPIESLKDTVPQIIVENSFACLTTIALAARKKMRNPVIAITGSVGKSSTRLMIEHFIQDQLRFVATRGNHNTQSGVPLYGTKLCTNPQLGILEVSLNALNNRGNQSLTIQPDVAIVTSIGEAHLSTLHSTENIALFKARIFAGLRDGGLVILNKDIPKTELNVLQQQAKKKTSRIKYYSMKDTTADLFVKQIKHEKYKTIVTIHYLNEDYKFVMKLPSDGIIMNMLAAFLTLAELGFDLNKYLSKTESFQSLDKIMQLHHLVTSDKRRIDMIDDSHNAAIPSMINAIETFKQKAPFYKGTKILVLGQVADLGKNSELLHEQLIPYILSSGADYVFGHGYYMRDVIRKLPTTMVGGWFNNAKDLAQFIPLYCNDESFILLKGSVSGSDFKMLSLFLPNQLKLSNRPLRNFTVEEVAHHIQPVLGATLTNVKTGDLQATYGYNMSKSIEGLGPILLLYLLLEKGIQQEKQTKLHKWPTNKGLTIHKKPYKRAVTFTHEELIEELIYEQHPSAVFQLAYLYFNSRYEAMKAINTLHKQLQLSQSATLNLTGRYRVKEQQSFYLEDLQKIGRLFYPYRSTLRTLKKLDNGYEIKGIIFGNVRYSCIAFYEDTLICATGLRNIDELDYVFREVALNSKEIMM